MKSTQSTDILPPDVVLSISGVSKKFCRNLRRSMWYGMQDLGRSLLGVTDKRSLGESNTGDGRPADGVLSPLRRDEFWALQDVSLSLKKGESLGVIGLNGSGKSTLLRLVTGIYPPNEGVIKVRGRIGALIALGAGFHPHMTGRENIFLNGAILGIPLDEIKERLDEIVDFAGIGAFIDAPVSTYSSGMAVRLGFSVAVHMNPDILLVDEVFAVGDTSFQNKCIRYLRKLLSDDRTILVVSHTMSNIQRICSRVILLDHGRMVADGKPTDVIGEYMRRTAQAEFQDVTSGGMSSPVAVRTYQSDIASIVSAAAVDGADVSTDRILHRAEANLVVYFDVMKKIDVLVIEAFFLASSLRCLVARTKQFTHKAPLSKGRYAARIKCRDMNLAPGVYWVHATIYDENTVLSMVENLFPLMVVARGDGIASDVGGFFEIDGELSLTAPEATTRWQSSSVLPKGEKK